jgi:hypothetical protein
MLAIIEQSILSLLLALTCAAVPWLARRLRAWPLVGGLLVGIVVSFLGVALSLPLYPWSNLVVLLMALTAGLLLGRGVPPNFWPFLIVLVILSVLDAAQIALTGGLVPVSASSSSAHPAGAASGPLLYLNVLLPLPAGHYLLGIFDLLVLTAVAEHWRRRGGTYPLASLPGVLGFLLASGAVWVTQLGGWPLLPFLTAGWLCSEAASRVRSQPAQPAAEQRL